MKTQNLLLLVIFLIFSSLNLVAQIGIGTSSPHSSSVLDMTSTTQGVLTPRMTTTERNAISNPAEGLLVFDTDLNTFYFFDGAIWATLGSTTTKQTGWVALSDGDYSISVPGISVTQLDDPANLTDVNLNFINDASDNIIESYSPAGYDASDFFNNTTSRITPIETGDSIEMRLQFTAIPDSNNSFILIALDIGSPDGIIIFEKTVPLLKGSGEINKISESISLYQLDTFVANGAIIKIGYAATSGAPGNVALSGFSLVITRTHNGN
ncbi:hypothetical protein ACS386_08890 [Flavobacteriaceae bacterium LMO-SS05]